MDTITLGQRIREARTAAGLTRGDLGRRLRMCETHIAKWEKDRCGPTLFNAIELAKALGVSLDWLAGFTQERTRA